MDANRLLELAQVLGRYDAEGQHWAEVCAESEAENRPESYADAVAHGEALERLADEFASAARAVLDAS